ncbi:MAG: ATP-binding protein [Isosphaeraceae bacterium]
MSSPGSIAGSPDSRARAPYSVKRHGVTITNCDSEPVQTPGCIQDHGVLLVLRATDLRIVQASENTGRILGTPAGDLLGRPFGAIVGQERASLLREFLSREPTDRNPLFVFSTFAVPGMPDLDATVHTVDGLVVVELEATERAACGDLDYYQLVKGTLSRLQAAHTLRQFYEVVCEEIRSLTALDRVMVYKFHQDGHGEVFAESRRADLPSWIGLHYPADDIPAQVREIFKRLWIRPLPDATGGLAEMVPLLNPETGRPLDMTYCALRGASVMYTEYLANMGVKASLTLSLRRNDELWGLIACHHYSCPANMNYRVRAACEFLAQVVSLHHRAAEDREQAAARHRLEEFHHSLVAQMSRDGTLDALTEGTPSLLEGMDAGGAAVYHQGQWRCAGRTPSQPELDGLAEWLVERPEFLQASRPIYATDCLAHEYPRAASFSDVASGLLAMPLSQSRRSFLLWFRPETIRTVNWGGNPHDKPTVPGPQGPRLTPRRSFELFAESVRFRSLPWREFELDAAIRLRVLVLDLVFGRAERLAELNEGLARSNEELDAFAYVASHDLKEPLRGIHKYAHQLLEEAEGPGEDRRDRASRILRLTTRMDSLLDSLLELSRVGRVPLVREDVDFAEVLSEAAEMIGLRHLSGDGWDIIFPRPFPRLRCDRVRFREILVNLLSNAMKYNDAPRKRIEVGWIAPGGPVRPPAFSDEAEGEIVYYVKDNGIGIHPRFFTQVFRIFKRLHGRDEYGGGTGAGLTIVKRLVERHRGQVWIDSAPGEGSTFYFTLPAEPEKSDGR